MATQRKKTPRKLILLFLFQFSVVFVPLFMDDTLTWLSLEPPYRTFPIDWPVVWRELERMPFWGLAFAIWSVIWHSVLEGLKYVYDSITRHSYTKELS